MINIMLVDDERVIREGLSLIINALDSSYKIIAKVTNGSEALELMHTFPPDIVITDIKMPVMDGIELIERMQEKFPEIKKVVLSGFDEFEYVRQSMKCGAVDYLLKPVNESELADLLEELCAVISKEKGLDTPATAENENYLIKQIKSYIEQNYQEEMSLTSVAKVVNVNSNYLSVMFKNQTGESFVDYFTKVRIEKAKKLLKDVRLKTYEVGEHVGYKDAAYFSKVFKKFVGMSPSEYRNR